MFVSEQLKKSVRDIPIMDVARLLNIDFHNGTLAHCFIPGHPDRHASLRFWPARNRWKCFSCTSDAGRKGGDAITLVMVHEGLPYNEAVIWLANHFGIPVAGLTTHRYHRKMRPWPPKSGIGHRVAVKKPDTEPDIELLEWVVNTGKLCPEAKTFLFEERRFEEDVILSHRIFSISDKFLFANVLIEQFGRERALRSGLITGCARDSAVSAIGDRCVVFPYLDFEGNVINLQSRKYVPCEKKDRYKFPPGLPVHMFNLDRMAEYPAGRPVFIAEGVTDCLAMMSDGKNAVAIPGVNNLNPDDIFALQNHRLFIYPDNDTAGAKLTEILNTRYELNVGVMRVPEPYGDYCDYYSSKRNETETEQACI